MFSIFVIERFQYQSNQK
ncbi:TPA: erythromycin resistance leader peptide [Streptococcus agalactiae]